MIAYIRQGRTLWILTGALIIALAAFFGTRAVMGGGGEPAAPSAITTPPAPDLESSQAALEIRIQELKAALRDHPERFPDPAQLEKLISEAEQGLDQGKIDAALFEAEKAKPKFEGVISGIFITPDTRTFGNAQLSSGAAPCFVPALNASDPNRSEVIGNDSLDANGLAAFNTRVAGDPLDIVPTYLPAGMQESYNQWATACDGGLLIVSRSYLASPGPEVTIQKYKSLNAFLISASNERIESVEVGGRPVVFVKGIGLYYPGQQVILVKTDYGLLVVESTSLPFAELVKVAEGIK